MKRLSIWVNLNPLETVLIHAGAGGVGGAAVQLTHAIDYVTEDFSEVLSRLTNNRGIDLILDVIGAPYFERNVNSLNFGGRLVQIGIMGGGNAKIPLDRVLYRHLQIIGTVMKSRSQDAKHDMSRRFKESGLTRFGKNGLSPVIDSMFPLTEARLAHQHMEDRLNVGKIVLTM